MKKLILGLLTILTVFLLPITAYAAKENGTCEILVHYSSFIEPVENDNFTLTFKDSKGNEQSFDFNASAMVDASGSFELPLGVYTIVELSYKGDGYIDDYGYSIPAYFIVADDDSKKPIEIALGHEEIRKMHEAVGEDSIQIYQNSMNFQKLEMLYNLEEPPEEIDWDMHPGNDYIFYNGEILGDDEAEIQEPTIDDMIENAVDPNLDKAAQDPENISSPEATISDQAEEILPVIEEKVQETAKEEPNINTAAHRKSLIARVAILGILVILVAVLLLILKKQGKI